MCRNFISIIRLCIHQMYILCMSLLFNVGIRRTHKLHIIVVPFCFPTKRFANKFCSHNWLNQQQIEQQSKYVHFYTFCQTKNTAYCVMRGYENNL